MAEAAEVNSFQFLRGGCGERSERQRWGLFTRDIERNEFSDDARWWGGGRNTGFVKGGLPLGLTLDASRVLQQVEAAAVNLFRFHSQGC